MISRGLPKSVALYEVSKWSYSGFKGFISLTIVWRVSCRLGHVNKNLLNCGLEPRNGDEASRSKGRSCS